MPRRDDHETLLGVLVPALMVLLVIVNLATGKVWIPASRSGLLEVTNPLIVSGFVLLKLACALGLFQWHWVANRQAFDPYVLPLQITAVLLGIIGIGITVFTIFA